MHIARFRLAIIIIILAVRAKALELFIVLSSSLEWLYYDAMNV